MPLPARLANIPLRGLVGRGDEETPAAAFTTLVRRVQMGEYRSALADCRQRTHPAATFVGSNPSRDYGGGLSP